MSLRERLVERIHRQGPLPFDAYVETALYDPELGFFAAGGGAGRAGADFLTAPETGALYGALLSRALDGWWDELGRPDPFVVVEAGAGRGRLAADVLAAAPRCASALRYVLVERSAPLRAEQRMRLQVEPVEDALGPSVAGEGEDPPQLVAGVGPVVTALDELPAIPIEGVIFANELLDNLPFAVVARTPDGAWEEVRVGARGDELVEVRVEARPGLSLPPVDARPGTRLPVPVGATAWIREAAHRLRRGRLVVVDYVAPWRELVAADTGWLRTYRAHRRGADPLAAPGEHDLTIDVPAECLEDAAASAGLAAQAVRSQADWLRSLGIDELADAAAARWRARAHVGDLEAIGARSRVHEADALVDRAGLGAHVVYVFSRDGWR